MNVHGLSELNFKTDLGIKTDQGAFRNSQDLKPPCYMTGFPPGTFLSVGAKSIVILFFLFVSEGGTASVRHPLPFVKECQMTMQYICLIRRFQV